jgi:hypothetical protein
MSVISPDALVPADAAEAQGAVPVRFVGLAGPVDPAAQAWAARMGFKGKTGEIPTRRAPSPRFWSGSARVSIPSAPALWPPGCRRVSIG